jgi:hypothetical protein
MLQPTIWWFHQITGHPGSKRLHTQISACYYHRDLQRMIDNYHCDHCQCNKLDGKGYGHLPECEIQTMPFEECAVDLIGPWTIQVRDKPYEFNALTMIDTVSNLVEPVRIDDKTSGHIAKKYAQVWLSRYPWPAQCVCVLTWSPGEKGRVPNIRTFESSSSYPPPPRHLITKFKRSTESHF